MLLATISFLFLLYFVSGIVIYLLKNNLLQLSFFVLVYLSIQNNVFILVSDLAD